MNHRSEVYVNQSLASTGFVLLNPVIAARLRPDLWTAAQDAGFSLGGELRYLAKRPGLRFFKFTTSDGLHGRGAAYNLNQLSDRVWQLYGLRVSVWEVAAEEPALDAIVPPSPRVNSDRVQRLRDLASAELPAHDCPLRTEILLAREQVARLDDGKGDRHAR